MSEICDIIETITSFSSILSVTKCDRLKNLIIERKNLISKSFNDYKFDIDNKNNNLNNENKSFDCGEKNINFKNGNFEKNNFKDLEFKENEKNKKFEDIWSDIDEDCLIGSEIENESSNLIKNSYESSQLFEQTPTEYQKYRNEIENEKRLNEELKRSPYYEKIVETFNRKFGLHQFRKNQLQAIISSLSGKDCFVLMPTGGGKSLCYQLPALIDKGVTIIVSPLKALVEDQVQKLQSLQIEASHLLANQENIVEQQIFQNLFSHNPTLKMLYVTPEKISCSRKLESVFQKLYEKNLLSRIVVDEAHCISQWGHDFRPDYQQLKYLRDKFPLVPCIALTATATPRVQKDILNQLKMKSPEIYIQSFNRENLKYLVLPKTKDTINDMILRINRDFKNKSGIVYCFSRNETESVAKKLCEKGIRAMAYHAGLPDEDRTFRHENWLKDRYKVMCATIAFGMGIDKPDVRFVFHNSIPKSIEGYFQESGRAGRDGKVSYCILYYTYGDVHRIRGLIEKDSSSQLVIEQHITNLYEVVQFCENKIDCRRSQLLAYFGETNFDVELCKNQNETTCDNCISKKIYKKVNATEMTKSIVETISSIVHNGRWSGSVPKDDKYHVTINYIVEVFRGSQQSKIIEKGHNNSKMYGKGSHLKKNDAERLIRLLIYKKILSEQPFPSNYGGVNCYLKLGTKCREIFEPNYCILFSIQNDEISEISGINKTNKLEKVNNKNSENIQELIESIYNNTEFMLLEARNELSDRLKINNPAMFYPTETIHAISRLLPTTENELYKIDGITEPRVKAFGSTIFMITKEKLEEIRKISNKEAINIKEKWQKLEERSIIFEDDDDDFSSKTSHYWNSKSKYNKKSYEKKKRKNTNNYNKKKSKINSNNDIAWMSKNQFAPSVSTNRRNLNNKHVF